MGDQGQDLIINRILTKDEIINSFSHIYGINRDEISICKSIEDPALQVRSNIKILCVTMKVDYSFPMRIDYYLRDTSLEPENYLDIIIDFCKFLNCDVIISDSSLNPFSFILVNSNGKYSTIYLKEVELSNLDKPKPLEIN